MSDTEKSASPQPLAVPSAPPMPKQATASAQASVPPPMMPERPDSGLPVDLWGTFDPPTLPHGVLPEVLEQFAHPVALQMGVDPAALAMSALVACAAATPETIRLQPKEHDPRWQESARLWVALVGMPSTKKSPAFSRALAPIYAIDSALIQSWQVAKKAWDALPAEERKATPEPRCTRLRLSDTTPEAAQEVLRNSPDGLALTIDELSGWFGAMERGGGKGAGAERAFWLQAFNGGQHAVNRVGRGHFVIPNLSVNVVGGIQPDVIRRVAAGTADDGLLQRFLPIVLRAGDIGQDAPAPWEAGLYEFAVKALHGKQGDKLLQFDPEAQQVFRQVQLRHHRLTAIEAVNRRLAAHIGKLDGIFARLCVVFHCAANPWTPTVEPLVSADTARRVERFMGEFLLPHALSFYSGVLAMADDQEDLAAVAGYILSKHLTEIDHRTLKGNVRSCRKLDKAGTRTLLEQLAAFRWLEPVFDPDKRTGEPRWFVNPHVHVMFVDRAEREAARRHQVRATILEISGQRRIEG